MLIETTVSNKTPFKTKENGNDRPTTVMTIKKALVTLLLQDSSSTVLFGYIFNYRPYYGITSNKR